MSYACVCACIGITIGKCRMSRNSTCNPMEGQSQGLVRGADAAAHSVCCGLALSRKPYWPWATPGATRLTQRP